MSTREFTEAQIEEMDLDDIAHVPHRHGTTTTFVFDHDGAHWRFTALMHHDEGLQLFGPVTCTQVQQVERTVKVWEAVK